MAGEGGGVKPFVSHPFDGSKGRFLDTASGGGKSRNERHGPGQQSSGDTGLPGGKRHADIAVAAAAYTP